MDSIKTSIKAKDHTLEYGIKVVLLLVSIFLAGSCRSTRNLEKEQYALIKNVYAINTDDNRVDKGKIKTEIRGLVEQTPVKKGWLNPRTWLTPLTIYDRSQTEESAASMEQFLRNRKGFYHANIDFQESATNNKIVVTYKVELGQRYYVGDIQLEGSDSTLLRLFNEHIDGRLVNKGDALDAQIFDKEELRLINIAKNNGYADFNPNYIEFRGDSSTYEVPVKIYIYNPLNQTKHQQYTIGEINVYTEHIASPEPLFRRTDTLESQNYFSKSSDYIVAPDVIEKIVSLKKGNTFNRNNEFLTNRTLSRLSPYRFVKVDAQVSESNDSIYNYNIFLTPHDHKWAFDMGANFFYSLLNQAPSVASNDLLGFGGNIGWENRNFRNRAITHSFGLEGVFEFQIPTFAANTFSIQANNSFRIPHIVDVFKLAPFLNKVGLLTDRSHKNLNLYGSTEVDLSFGVTDILNAYRLNTLNASWAYSFQPDEYNRYIWTQIGISVLDTKVDSTFQVNVLNQNPLLNASFSDYLFTGFLLREVNIFKQSQETLGGSYFAFIGDVEISGLENWAVNKIVNSVSSYDDKWTIAGLKLSSFVKLEADLRYYKKIKDRSTFAARFDIGTAITFGSDEPIPFVKSFFVGGPNSLRGWQLRELGPGVYSERVNNPLPGQPFFQIGDFKMEMNVEYRFDLFWFWEGAIFVDAGNIWTLKADAERPGSKISSSLFNEMAISTGWGLRFDFDYFLLRFDFGYKLRNPFPDPETNSHIVLTNGDYNGILGNVNFAINYPF